MMECSLAAVVLMAFTWVGKEIQPPVKDISLPRTFQSSTIVKALAGSDSPLGVYKPNGRLLVVGDNWDCDRLRDQAVVVHEMVHHYQNAESIDCDAVDCETPAHALERKFIQEND